MMQTTKRKSRKITDVKREGNSLYLYSAYGLFMLTPKSETILHVVFTGREQASCALGAGFVPVGDYGGWEHEETEDTVILVGDCMTVFEEKLVSVKPSERQ